MDGPFLVLLCVCSTLEIKGVWLSIVPDQGTSPSFCEHWVNLRYVLGSVGFNLSLDSPPGPPLWALRSIAKEITSWFSQTTIYAASISQCSELSGWCQASWGGPHDRTQNKQIKIQSKTITRAGDLVKGQLPKPCDCPKLSGTLKLMGEHPLTHPYGLIQKFRPEGLRCPKSCRKH